MKPSGTRKNQKGLHMVPSMWKSTGRALTGTGAWELAKSFPDLETRGSVPSRGGCPQAPAPRNWPWTLSGVDPPLALSPKGARLGGGPRAGSLGSRW